MGVDQAYRLIRGKLKAEQRESVAESIEEQEGCTLADLQSQITKGIKYGCIYADPPWAYGNQSTRAATGNHYVTMSVQDICDLPVKELAADEAHLHLWTTNAFLRDSYTLMEAWGFDYRSILVWCKGDDEASPQIGIGNYWRVNTEYLLLGIRGGLQFAKTPEAKKAQLSSWIHHKRMGHSRKPPVFRELIEAVSPGPRLELFGRMAVPGWDVWGNEVERTLFAGANRG
jgi:N6-adenosine-specific RNA methylase IME4